MNGLIVSIICAGVYAAIYFVKSKASGRRSKEVIGALVKEFNTTQEALIKKLDKTDNLASAKQIAAVQAQISAVESSIAHERAQLAKVEETLAKSQLSVEERENNHQNMKIAKVDEDDRIQQLLEKHESLSAESIQLEKELAESMKNLDSLLSEAGMSEAHKGMLRELQTTLEAAGARLRELISEYESVKTRVDTLRLQHIDLEEEYTRLVELQLG
jgi:chromosome segregation ATPase